MKLDGDTFENFQDIVNAFVKFFSGNYSSATHKIITMTVAIPVFYIFLKTKLNRALKSLKPKMAFITFHRFS